MQYMKLEPVQREALLASLQHMPDWLADTFAVLSPEQARAAGTDGAFSPVEQVWHLADLEREGFGLRISRLQTEQEPLLADFDGTAVALTRDYRSRSLQEGIAAFRQARERNLATLRGISADAWSRGGSQEGVGQVTLCDLPELMRQHDEAHRGEIGQWLRR